MNTPAVVYGVLIVVLIVAGAFISWAIIRTRALYRRVGSFQAAVRELESGAGAPGSLSSVRSTSPGIKPGPCHGNPPSRSPGTGYRSSTITSAMKMLAPLSSILNATEPTICGR